jgi:uncharacterized protein (DUF1684 family)
MTFGVGDALDLLDWKRQIFALYERVRASTDPRQAWQLWRDTRDQLYREHPQSPLPSEQRDGFPGCSFFAYDPEARVLATVEPSEPVHRAVSSSTGAAFPFSDVGTARFTLGGEDRSLALLWNEGYGGGLFVSFQDETSGVETYPAARYLLDTAKGADLGTQHEQFVLDFDFAYSPSCAYDSAWACPLAPSESRLTIAGAARIRAAVAEARQS